MVAANCDVESMRTHRVKVVRLGNQASPHLDTWDRGREQVEVVDVDSHPPSLAAALVSALRVLALLAQWLTGRRHGILVEAHGAGRAGFLASKLPLPYLVIVHGSEVLRAEGPAERRWIRVCRSAAAVIVTSDATARHIMAAEPDLADSVVVVHPGVDWDGLGDMLGEHVEPGSVLSIRRALSLYRVDIVVEGFLRVSSPGRGDQPTLTVLRGDVTGQESEAARVLSRVAMLSARAGDAAVVDVVEQWMSRGAFHRSLADHAVAVSLARSDQLSASVLEALAAGCHVVLTDLEAYGELRDLGQVVVVPVDPTAVEVGRAIQRAIAAAAGAPKATHGAVRAAAARQAFGRMFPVTYAEVLAGAVSTVRSRVGREVR